MSIAALSLAAKAKTALTYCCVGALSFGASQVYEKHAPRQKARTHKVARPPIPTQAALCPTVGVAPLFARGERIDIAASLPQHLSSGFLPIVISTFPIAPPAAVPAPTEVPEPAAIGLFGLGALAIFRRRRRPAGNRGHRLD